MSGPGTTVRIYVCSCFEDMRAERACLHGEVFPALQALFEGRGVRIEPVDLHQDKHLRGAPPGGDLLSTALDQIDQSRPFFIALLGERYGAPVGPIPDHLRARHPWLAYCGTLSLLPLEIFHGIGRPGQASRSFYYLRQPDFMAGMPADRRGDFVEPGPGAYRLRWLKEVIRMSGQPVREYPCRWDPAAGTVAGLDEFRAWVLADLSGAVADFLAGIVPAMLSPEPEPGLVETPSPRATAQVIVCPKCSAVLQVPDGNVGKQVRCPKCQTVFPIPAEQYHLGVGAVILGVGAVILVVGAVIPGVRAVIRDVGAGIFGFGFLLGMINAAGSPPAKHAAAKCPACDADLLPGAIACMNCGWLVQTAEAEEAEEEAIRLDENVQFTVYRPALVRPGEWYPLLAFVHLSERPPDAPPDQPDPIQEVERQARQLLGEQAREYQDVTQDSQQAVPRAGEITFVPDVPGVEFNPPQRTFRWLEPVHREEFRLKASPQLDGRTARGRLTVFLGSVILADVSLAIRVDSTHRPADSAPPTESDHGRPYRKVFASYSHKDLEIVRQCQRFAWALGDEYLRDWTHLRAGEVWDQRLCELIEQADVFQLFWSCNSMRSEFVRREWEHALSLGRPHFVRPTYWEDPMPEAPDQGLPPEALRRLHFQRLPLRRPGRTYDKYEPLSRAPRARRRLRFLWWGLLLLAGVLAYLYLSGAIR